MPMVFSLKEYQTFVALIKGVYQEQDEAQEHRDFPFEELPDHLSVERDPSRHPLFQVMFSVQHFGKKKAELSSDYMLLYGLRDNYQVEKFDLSILIDDSCAEIMVHMSYATSLFKSETI